jgi:hypothetical protein
VESLPCDDAKPGAASLAFTVTFKAENQHHWSEALKFGDVSIKFHERGKMLELRVGHHRMHSPGNVFSGDKEHDFLFTVGSTGYAEIWINGILAGRSTRMKAPSSTSPFRIGTDNFKGTVADLKVFGEVVSWSQAFGASELDAGTVLPKLVKPDSMCHSHHQHEGQVGSVADCAAKVHKKGGKFFIFGKVHAMGQCYLERTDKCTRFRNDDNYDFYAVLPGAPAKSSGIPFPTEEAVSTDYGNERVSKWITFQKGQSYPFKLERRLAARSETTGVDGWKKIGLECETLEGASASGDDPSEAMLPQASYVVDMKMHEYPVQLNIPKSSDGSGYKLAFRSNEIAVDSDAGVGPGLLSLLGAKCDISGGGDKKVVNDFEKEGMQKPDAEAACGIGAKSASLGPAGEWRSESITLSSKEYALREYPFLHMCYKIAPGAVVNMVIEAKVGWRNRVQSFSVGMTDSRFQTFHHERKRAAQWPIKLVNSSTTGTWECASINLQGQLQEFDGYERRFHDINYRHGPTSTARDAPGPSLQNVRISKIMLASGFYSGGWQKLGGAASIDMLAFSNAEFHVTPTHAAPLTVLPIKKVEGAHTATGDWKVEWFDRNSRFLGRLGYADAAPDVITNSPALAFNKDRDNCKAAGEKWASRRCDNYGWRATGTINIDSAGKYKFYYVVDDILYIFIDGKPLGGRLGRRGGPTTFTEGPSIELSAGQHEVEVHMWQGGGGEYGAVKWQKEGESTFHTGTYSPQGINADAKITFTPPQRKDLPALQAFLQEFSIKPLVAGGSVPQMNTTLPRGTPPANTVTATMAASSGAPVIGSWAAVVMVKTTRHGKELAVNVGKDKFNEMFAACPVVRYVRDGATHSIYSRMSAIPDNFDAYKLFTEDWSDRNANRFKEDFNLYTNLEDVTKGANAWNYCNFGGHVGYPRQCGVSRADHNKHEFNMPDRGGPMRALTAGFEMFNGAECPSKFGSSSSSSAPGDSSAAPQGPATVTFSMDDSGEDIAKMLLDAGVADVNVDVLSDGELAWLSLGDAEVAIGSGRYPERLTDSNKDSCAEVGRDKPPWALVKLGGEYEVSTVKLVVHGGGFTVSVDGKACAENVGSGEVACSAKGSTLMIHHPTSDFVRICDLAVGVLDFKAKSAGKEAGSYSLRITNTKRGGGNPRISFASELAAPATTSVLSTGARFWDDVTDYWFRMPYDSEQVQLGDWRSYVCSSHHGSGVRAATGQEASLLQTDRLMALFQTSHAARGHVSHTQRRMPVRKWRLQPRYHTDETLDSLKRRVLGVSDSPLGWKETQALLQMHAGSQHEFKHGDADPRDDPSKGMRWSHKSSWGGEDPPNGQNTDIVFIPEGKTGLLDMDINIRFWVVEGNLIWDMDKDINMGAEAVVVNGGNFLIGKESNPYAMQGTLTLHGHWHSMKLPLCGAKTVFQTDGNIEMHGIPVAVTWTDLASTVQSGGRVIHVRDAVDWKPGSMIVVAASDAVVAECRLDRRDRCQVEERYVQSVDPSGLFITLDRPLVYRHVGEEYDAHLSHKGCDTQPHLCAKTQVRAEVGLLSRNIKVKGSNYEDGSGPAGSEGYGGHLMHAVKAQYTYIEFHWMGQAFQMGRYPLHLHLTGLNPDSKILGCALHRTFQRGITVHGTHGSLIKDNVLYNHLSHGYFIEDGNEHDNIFDRNLGMMTHPSYSMLLSDQTPATFWIRNPSNYFRNNHAAGSMGFGFWFDTHGRAMQLEQRQFENQTAHSNAIAGLWVDFLDSREGCFASHTWTVGVPAVEGDGIAHALHLNAPHCVRMLRKNTPLLSTTTWGNSMGTVLFEVGHLHLENHRSVSDGGAGVVVWGVKSDNWPDETNDWYGPVVKNGALHAESDLPFGTNCGVGGPWDDTLFVTNMQFHGKYHKGGFCACFFCLTMEGGYQIRTSKLGWHDGAGTVESKKAHWPWAFSSTYFDFDGTLTEVSDAGCKMSGCYLHSPFDDKAGRYMSPAESSNSSVSNTLGLLESDSDNSNDCKSPLVAADYNTPELAEAMITASSYRHNRPDHGKGEMKRSYLNYPQTSWVAGHNNHDQWIQWDFGTSKFVTGIQTQGRSNYDNWVKTYKLKYTADGDLWKDVPGPREYMGNGDRTTVVEHRISPLLATKLRLYPLSWHRDIALRGNVIGCSGDASFTKVCMDKQFLDEDQQDCRTLERTLGDNKMKEFCIQKGHKAMYTLLNANQACCACGGGDNIYVADAANETSQTKVPKPAWRKFWPSGTGHLPADKCREVDATGGIVCDRQAKLNTISVTNAGLWHGTNLVVQTDYGFVRMIFQACYSQYEFTSFSDSRIMIVPPYEPSKLFDWGKFEMKKVRMIQGERFVLQWETIHNPDGFEVKMGQESRRARIDMAPVQYDASFTANKTLLEELGRSLDPHSAKQLKLDTALDLYKVAHRPLLDLADSDNSAGLWGYLQANTSYKVEEWYPGSLQILASTNGVPFAKNHVGPWNGLRRNIMEKMTTRPLHSDAWGSKHMHSHQGVLLSWEEWFHEHVPGQRPPAKTQSRLEYLVQNCDVLASSFSHYGSDALDAVKNHKAVKDNKVVVGERRVFKWSEWPQDLGGKPQLGRAEDGFGNVTIEQNWEVTIDEDVDFINKLNISGVLKFADKAGCCKLVARYIFVGPIFGRFEAGTEDAPITHGHAHIVLKGQPMTPKLSHFNPHLRGSAKWLGSKWIAVMGLLSLHGTARPKTWTKLAQSTEAGATELTLIDASNFKQGDVIALQEGLETRTITQVSANTITLSEALKNSYRGAEYAHLDRAEVKGLMATPVGLVDGHRVIVEGEDTPGVPMCDVDANRTCPYSQGMPPGMNLHDFAKEMRYYNGAHPNCRPCLAVSEMGFGGKITAMSHFHHTFTKCPKDHGVIQISGAVFKHASKIEFYSAYHGDGAPHGEKAAAMLASEWAKRQYVWWQDPVWKELDIASPPIPAHKAVRSAFNNSYESIFHGHFFSMSLAIPKKMFFGTELVTQNVFLGGGVTIDGVVNARGEGSPAIAFIDAMTAGGAETGQFRFEENFLSGSLLTTWKGDLVKNNMIMAEVLLGCGPVVSKETARFTGNTISSTSADVCVKTWTTERHGVSDNTIHSCKIGLEIRQVNIARGTIARMKLLNNGAGFSYYSGGADADNHDMEKTDFHMRETQIYAKANGGGIGLYHPKAGGGMRTLPPGFPAWHIMTGLRGVLYFHTRLESVTWIGYKKANGGVALSVGKSVRRTQRDNEHQPIMVKDLKFVDMDMDSALRHEESWGEGFEDEFCIQIDCDGRRNTLVIDEDGSLIGKPGTVIPEPQKFYDKLAYSDPMGFDTMEDLIPMPARYDRFGDAIPFPTGVDHGTGGGLEYLCNLADGCDVLFQSEGHWIASKPELKLVHNTKVVAIREDGGLIRLDPLHHGWAYATGWVRTSSCVKTMDPYTTEKPESQHARRYGRVHAGEFGIHPNSSRVLMTRGPVYTQAGIYRKGCEYNSNWQAYSCQGGKHRHLVVEVMDWNHKERRWAPVSVEVNDNHAPQGGTMNIMSGPAKYDGRLQTFWALGHVGMRHNVYFTADPPAHLRLHLQYADPSEGIVVCVYYGIPNQLVAYVGGKRKAPELEPTWDQLVYRPVTADEPHGTFYYDRLGVETGRPGYLYAVVRGSQHVDFKISHKVILTTKIKVDASWGSWKGDKDEDGDESFYKKGIDGLVRNIALLIGCPPTRIKILGNGTARKGTFWNEKTTSTEFAKWIWEQNNSLDRTPMSEWLQNPTSQLPSEVSDQYSNTSTGSGDAELSLLQAHHQDPRTLAFTSQFAEHRREHVINALSTRGLQGEQYHYLSLLTSDEREAVVLRRAYTMLAENGENELDKLQEVQNGVATRNALGSQFDAELAAEGAAVIDVEADADEDDVPSTLACSADNKLNCDTLDQHANNQGELKIEGEGMNMLSKCSAGTNGCTLPSDVDSESTGLLEVVSGGTQILKTTVDNVPTKNNPLGWLCATDMYEDGNCDCDCGVYDPDCETGSNELYPAIHDTTENGEEVLELLDKDQAGAVISWLDAAANSNGVLDGIELTKLETLGASALYGVAQRILKAETDGDMRGGQSRSYRLGNFAHLQAKESQSCAKLLKEPPFPEGTAVYTPMCVKDQHFITRLGQPTGRCALLPKMAIGSQCVVPGSGKMEPEEPGGNQSRTSSASVCGRISQIFPRGLGQGGILSGGVGVSSAEWFYEAAEFIPGSSSRTALEYLDMKTANKEGLGQLDSSFGQGMSFYVKLKFESFMRDSRIFEFGNSDERNPLRLGAYISHRHGQTAESPKSGITMYTDAKDLHARRRRHTRGRLEATDAATSGKEDGYLFTYDPHGDLAIWRNGILLAKTQTSSHDTGSGAMEDAHKYFDKFYIGGQIFETGHHHHRKRNTMDGEMSDIRVWSHVVTWDTAVSGTPVGQEPVKGDQKEEKGEVDTPCIASLKNSWDFVCDDELPEDLQKEFGRVSTGSAGKAQKEFDTREKRGEVTSCGASMNVKGVIYAGKFGDGLTAEYFRMRVECNRMPGLFGKLPKLVRVDEEINFNAAHSSFSAPDNEYAIRWTGKILIEQAGVYEFSLGADDGAWLAIDGVTTVSNGNCAHGNNQFESKTASLELDKGGHEIAVLYYNKGPRGKSDPGRCELKYKGLDTNGQMQMVPTAKLGSAPLRLAKLAKELSMAANKTDDKPGEAIPGSIVYDEDHQLGIMPKGSCDFDCRKGKRKNGGAYFSFFCSKDTDVTLVAKVNTDAKQAFAWMDDHEATIWSLDSGNSMLEKDAVMMEGASESNEHHEAFALASSEFPDPGPMVESAASRRWTLSAGFHTVVIQGRFDGDDSFALKNLRFQTGADDCAFFLEGKDKGPSDC